MQDKEIIRNLVGIILVNLPEMVFDQYPEELKKLQQLLTNADQNKLIPLNGPDAMKLGLNEMLEYLAQVQ